MFRSMTKQEFLDWWAFDMVEPLGGNRGDYQAASMCAAMMNGFAALARSKKRFKIDDFLFKWGKDVEAAPAADGKTPWQQMKMVARMWTAASKVDDKRPARAARAPKRGRAEQVAAARAALVASDRRAPKG